jgi:HK97 family phage major capsid protein
MALKVLMLRKKLSEKNKELSDLKKALEGFTAREAELEKSIEEAETDEEKKAVEDAVSDFEKEKAEAGDKATALETEIKGIETEIEDLERSVPKPERAEFSLSQKRGEQKSMNTRKFFGMSPDERDAFVGREDVKEFLARAREMGGSQSRGVTGAELGIPEVVLELLRDNMYRYSKLITKVRLKPVTGKARQNISGTVPEGVWMEAVASLNELEIVYNQIEVDGYKVGGFIPIPNSTLADSDLNLSGEILDALGQAIGLAIDKAILYGSGTKMPLGIATRLAQTSKPSSWGLNAPAWTDLHTSNILKINPSGMTAEAFFAALVLNLGVAAPNFATGGTFWAMNRKTRMTILSKSITFNASGAIVAGQMGTMPIEGGEIVELDFIPDNDIIGGFGSLYLLAEREGSLLSMSEHVRFLQDQTVYKGTARYDGAPVIGEGFVIVNINNASATTTKTFETDYANTELGALGVTSVAGTASGDTLITVTGAESSGTTLGYKVLGRAASVASGDSKTGYTDFTTPDDITAATGKVITVVEFDAAGRAIKVGSASVASKA